ncbi:STAS domain-containing protein [Streptomyces sp. NPDC054838]
MGDKLRFNCDQAIPRCRLDLFSESYAQIRRVNDFTVIEFHGEIDLVADLRVRAHVDAATDTDQPRIVVDLRTATFIDCSTLRMLCHARKRALDNRGGMGLVCTLPRHLGILKAVRLTSVFGPVATLEEAYASALRGA